MHLRYAFIDIMVHYGTITWCINAHSGVFNAHSMVH